MFAGRSHQLALGLSHRRWKAAGQGWSLPGWRNGVSVHALHAEPQPLPPLALLQTYAYQYRQTLAPTQTGAWLAAQLQLAERWQLYLGSRWERYRHQEEVGDNYRAPQSLDRRRDRHHSRYAALVWALDARHSAYLHSSDSFLPRQPARCGRPSAACGHRAYFGRRGSRPVPGSAPAGGFAPVPNHPAQCTRAGR